MSKNVNQINFTGINDFCDYLYSAYEQEKDKADDAHLSTGKEQLLELLNANKSFLKDIIELFQFPPHPKVSDLIHQLQKNYRDLRLYIEQFNKDPKAGRVAKYSDGHVLVKSKEHIFNEQFDSTQVSRVLAEIQDLMGESTLSKNKQYHLAQQAVYINAVGKEYPLVVGNTSYEDLTQVTRTDLRHLSDELITQIRNPSLSQDDKLKAQLKLLVVMREQYFRVTGIFINTTQILSLLISLAGNNEHLLIQQGTQDDSSINIALLAAMQWVEADGGSIDVCVANKDLVARGFVDKAAEDFFTSLGITSAVVAADSKAGTYQVGGINYTTLIDLSGYCSRAKSDAEALRALKNGYLTPCRLIIDESGVSQSTQTVFHTNPISRKGDYQFLQDRMYEEASGDLQVLVDSDSVNELIRAYREQGRIIGILGALSDEDDSLELDNVFSIGVAYRIPDHKKAVVASDLDSFLANEEKLIERHYKKAVTRIQRVVMGQFEDWQAFLHLIYPKSDWFALDRDLLIQKELLVASLNEQWHQCIESSDPKHVYSNPFVRRDGDYKLQTKALDKVLTQYEQAVCLIWEDTRRTLALKTGDKIRLGSVNALRYEYMQGIQLSEMLQLDKLIARQHKKTQIKERLATSMHVASGLDVHGAMLRYAGAHEDQHRAMYIMGQIQVLSQEIIKLINRANFSKSVTLLLTNQVTRFNNLMELEQFLIDYGTRWLGLTQNIEKYHMQPVVGELLRLYKQTGLPYSAEFKELKKVYLDNITVELIDRVETALSWALPQNKGGIWYWLERTAVKKAADDLLIAVSAVKSASDSQVRDVAIKYLYKTLAHHQVQLNDLWIFSFGHQSTRDFINQTLSFLDDLTAISSNEDEFNTDIVRQCREEVGIEIMTEQLKLALEKLEKNYVIADMPDWQGIKAELFTLQKESNHVYGIDHLYYFLSKKAKELNGLNSKLLQPIIDLRGEVRGIWNKFYQNNTDLIHESRFYELKAEQIKADLSKVVGCDITKVTFKPVHTGFSDYFELILEGTGFIPLLRDFVHYNSQLSLLQSKHEELTRLYDDFKNQSLSIAKLQNEIIPALVRDIKPGVNALQFPEVYQIQVNEVITLRHLMSGHIPSDLSIFPANIQDYFLDRELLKSFDSTMFTLDQVAQVHDQQLRDELTILYNKTHQLDRVPAQSRLGALASYVAQLFSPSENIEDFRYQFSELSQRPSQSLQNMLTLDISTKLEKLKLDVNDKQSGLGLEMQLLQERLEFINEQLIKERKGDRVFIKRFNTRGEFYEFEKELRAFQSEHVSPNAAEQNLSSDTPGPVITPALCLK